MGGRVMRIRKLGLVAALAISMAATTVAQVKSTPLSLKPRAWTLLGNTSLSTAADGSLMFVFPQDMWSVNYLYTGVRVKGQPSAIRVTLAVTTVGTPTWNYVFEPENTCIAPATVRPFINAHNDWNGEFGRWWSNPTAYTLGPGTITLTVPLTPDIWSDVNGLFGASNPAA